MTTTCVELELPDRLSTEVYSFTTGSFHLRDDLINLDRVRHVQAHEAVVLYAARVLEALVGEAVVNLGLRSERSIAADLDMLFQFNLIPVATRAWGHTIRRVGNDARHVRRVITNGDADLVVLFLERLLNWFFCCYRFQTPVAHLTLSGERLWPLRNNLPEMLAALEAVELTSATHTVFEQVKAQGQQGEFWCSPTLPGVLAEFLLDQDEKNAAEEILNTGIHLFPTDLRLKQLWGLYLSRTGRAAEALQVLGPLRVTNPRDPDDSETEGIYAGALKRLGKIKESQEIYANGWKKSEKTNLYLGINAAGLAVHLNKDEEANQIATTIRNILLRRLERLRNANRVDVILNYWDQVTLGEAQLILKEFDEAAEAYRLAFTRYPEQIKNIKVTRNQAEKLLTAMNEKEQIQHVLG